MRASLPSPRKVSSTARCSDYVLRDKLTGYPQIRSDESAFVGHVIRREKWNISCQQKSWWEREAGEDEVKQCRIVWNNGMEEYQYLN